MALITFNFPTENTGTKTNVGVIETIQLSVAITTTGGAATYTASDYNIRVVKYGDSVISFDLKTYVAASGRVNYDIFDPNGKHLKRIKLNLAYNPEIIKFNENMLCVLEQNDDGSIYHEYEITSDINLF